jgi:hypothetical protein
MSVLDKLIFAKIFFFFAHDYQTPHTRTCIQGNFLNLLF